MRVGSFRARLAIRSTALMALAFLVVAATAFLLLRSILTAQLDSTLIRLASIEASAVSDTRDSTVHFHEGIFSAPGVEHAAELARYAEVWYDDRTPVVRSKSLALRNLPLPGEAFAAARRGEVVLASVRWDNQPLRSILYPLGLVGPAHRMHILQIAAPLQPLTVVLKTLVQLLLALGAVVTTLTFVGAWGLASRAVRPAREIAEQAEAITAGSLAARIRAHGDAVEYERLVAVLNEMLTRLESAFEAQRRFVADAGHEIRHPVAVLRAALDLVLRRDRAPEEYRTAIADAVAQTDRISGLADGLLTLARADAGVLNPQRKPHELLRVAEEAVRRVELVAEGHGVRLSAHGEPTMAAVDADLLGRALNNLLDNALKFTPAGGSVTVTVESDAAAGLVHVTDTGPGVPAEHLPLLFGRFFRGDPSRAVGGGAGLGLAIAKGIAAAHGGEVTYTPNQPHGSRFTIRLPRFLQSGDPAGTQSRF